MISRRVDGIISIPMYPTKGAYKIAIEKKIPIVSLDSELKEDGCDSVITDNFQVGMPPPAR